MNYNPDFTEPLLLVEKLIERNISLINISMGSPYFNPHVTRPYDNPLPGKALPEEHPLVGVKRMINGTSFFQKRFPDIFFIGSAYSYLRQYAPNVGAAVISNGDASFIGLGRSSFAYPSLPGDLIKNGKADPAKVCITCSGCTRLIRNHRRGGCVIRDREIYGKELKKLIADGNEKVDVNGYSIKCYSINTLIIGSGAASLNAAVNLHSMGQKDILDSHIAVGRWNFK